MVPGPHMPHRNCHKFKPVSSLSASEFSLRVDQMSARFDASRKARGLSPCSFRLSQNHFSSTSRARKVCRRQFTQGCGYPKRLSGASRLFCTGVLNAGLGSNQPFTGFEALPSPAMAGAAPIWYWWAMDLPRKSSGLSSHVRRPFVRRPRGFFHQAMNAAVEGYRTH